MSRDWHTVLQQESYDAAQRCLVAVKADVGVGQKSVERGDATLQLDGHVVQQFGLSNLVGFARNHLLRLSFSSFWRTTEGQGLAYEILSCLGIRRGWQCTRSTTRALRLPMDHWDSFRMSPQLCCKSRKG